MQILNLLKEKLTNLVNGANGKGVPIPMIRDPKTGLGSVSLTLTFLSFNLVLFGLVGKLTKFLGEVDMTNGLWLFGICASLYFGRRISGDGKTIEVSDKVDGESK